MEYYHWVKSLHIVFVVAWFAGLFYLPRLFVYHALADDTASRERFKVMERKLYRGIMTPSMIATLVFGFWMIKDNPTLWFSQGWLHAKLSLVALLVVNAVYRPSVTDDPVSLAVARQGEEALAAMPADLRALPQARVPLRPFDSVGLPALRALFDDERARAWQATAPVAVPQAPDLPGLARLVDQLAGRGRGLVMVMGKGGVGKTTVAAALALGLVARGHRVHLTTTDPAAHLGLTLGGSVEGLQVSCIDPKAETRRYIDKMMATKGQGLDAQQAQHLGVPALGAGAVVHVQVQVVDGGEPGGQVAHGVLRGHPDAAAPRLERFGQHADRLLRSRFRT